jgi:hypothetical protein
MEIEMMFFIVIAIFVVFVATNVHQDKKRNELFESLYKASIELERQNDILVHQIRIIDTSNTHMFKKIIHLTSEMKNLKDKYEKDSSKKTEEIVPGTVSSCT